MIYLAAALLASAPSGDTYFQATLFDKAQERYREEGDREKEVKALFLAKKPQEVIKRLENQTLKGSESFWLALSFEEMGDLKEAKALKDRYFESDPDAPFDAKIAHYLNTDQKEKAIASLENAPPNPERLHALITLKKGAGSSAEELKALRIHLLSFSPKTPFHAEAAFELWPQESYLMGSKEALNHLRHFLKEYPDSPFAILGWYLIGLDYKNERKSEGKRRIHFEDPDKSLHAFSEVEALWEKLAPSFSEEEKTYYYPLSIRAKFEKAAILTEMARKGNPSRRPLYFTFATEILAQIPDAEAHYKLGELYLEQNDLIAALAEFEKGALPNSEKGSSSFWNAKSVLKKGEVLYRLNKPEMALETLNACEREAGFLGLSEDEQLDAKINKSLCLKNLNKNDEALLTLSEVINSDFASPCRIKAMVMRALIYEKEGKQKLAQRQYESAFLKGGAWAQSMKETWTKEFNPQ